MNILLINPMSSRKQPEKGRSSHFPVGLGYVAAYLEKLDIEVDVLDNEVECLNKHELGNYIEDKSYDYYGLTGMSGNYAYIKGLSRIIKQKTGKQIGPLSWNDSNVWEEKGQLKTGNVKESPHDFFIKAFPWNFFK